MEKLTALKSLVKKYNETSLILRILTGIVVGVILALIIPGHGFIILLGDLFVGSLKAIAPLLVFILVTSTLAQGNSKLDSRFAMVIFFYMLTTFLAAFIAVIFSYMFPQTIALTVDAVKETAPTGIGEVLTNLLTTMIANPLSSLLEGKYMGILFWAVVFGMSLKTIASDETKNMLLDLADGTSQVVRWIINMAPFGILGLVYNTVGSNGMEIFVGYGKLVLLLVCCMLFVSLIIDPLVIAVSLKCNPYPLVWRCLKGSGLTAFFTRSSAANIPMNMQLCENLGLDADMYSVSIPLGATINMDGAAITITIMTLAAANTMGIQVPIGTALFLSIIATLGACGASGVAGGSLLLIPMACSLFGISNDVAMQVVGVGFIIGVIQDSLETALNSSGDVMFAATAEYYKWKKEGKSLPDFLGGTTKTNAK